MGFQAGRGERIVFLGDSITEAHGFSNMAETWLSLRFPERRLSFFNAGWGGDTAPGALARLERDVLSLKPDRVVLCLGMNDGGYTFPRPDISGRFIDNLRLVLRRLKKAGAKVHLLTNGFADIDANPDFLRPVDYNRLALKRLAKLAMDLARQEKLPAFDLQALMTQVNARGLRKDPKFCMAPDGFHPDPAGHLVMAYGALKVLGVNSSGSLQKVKALPKTWGYEAKFKLAQAPYMVDAAARKVLPYLDFQKTFNDHRLAFSGLKPGRYQLQAGAWKSPVYSATELKQGVSMASFWDSPFMAPGQELGVFVMAMREIYARYWRALGMSGGYGAYRPGPHKQGIQAMPALEKEKQQLLAAPQAAITLRLVPVALHGEPVENGEFIGPWQFSQAFKGAFERDYLKGKVAWKDVRVDTNNPTQCFGAVLGRLQGVVAYARTELLSPSVQTAELLLGSGDGFEVWLNGSLLARRLDLRRVSYPDQERLMVHLKKGKNRLMIKVAQKQVEWWGFHARFAGLSEALLARHPR
ncbi:MAG: SGNH/GDSL hydrolase family protein [candidate division FCPU426 bacterium]